MSFLILKLIRGRSQERAGAAGRPRGRLGSVAAMRRNGKGRVTSIASESKPSCQQSVEHALAQSGGEFCNNAMTDHLLHHAIADREPASHRQSVPGKASRVRSSRTCPAGRRRDRQAAALTRIAVLKYKYHI